MTQPYYLPPPEGSKKKKGPRVPSVTTVLADFKNPGALMRWSWSVAKDVLDESLYLLKRSQRSIEQVLEASTSSDIAPLRSDIAPLQSTSRSIRSFLRHDPLVRADYQRVSREATTAGTYTHDLVERWIHAADYERQKIEDLKPLDLQKLKNCEQQIALNAWNALQAFFSWARNNHFEVFYTEIPLVSEQHKYGGTIDCVGWMDSNLQARRKRNSADYLYPEHDLVLLDWKTSKRLYTDYIIQIAAYGELWHENFDRPIDRYHLVRFDKVTAQPQHWEFSFQEMEAAKDAFLYLRQCFEINKQLAKKVKEKG